MRTNRTRAIERRCYHQRRTRNLIAGRTAHGTIWKRTPTLLAEQRPEHNRRRELVKYHRRTARRAALGLNSRGKPYKFRLIERAWTQLRAGMQTEGSETTHV
jgi:hypothetical protein